jgi:heme-degrading monooxygenase HmoA
MKIAETPKAPYYAVVFTIVAGNTNEEDSGMSGQMAKLAYEQEGFLGMEAAGGDLSIMVSYWDSLEAIQKWRMNSEHQMAQKAGKSGVFSAFKVRICKVERDYGFGM